MIVNNKFLNFLIVGILFLFLSCSFFVTYGKKTIKNSVKKNAKKTLQQKIEVKQDQIISGTTDQIKSDQSKSQFKYAIFDIGCSFWQKNLYDLLHSYQQKQGLSFSYYFKLIRFGVSYLCGSFDTKEAYQSFLVSCKKMSEKEFLEGCKAVWEKDCKNYIFQEAVDVFNECKKNGVVTILAEAGMQDLYQELVKKYPFDHLCCSEIEFKDGHISGKLIGNPCSYIDKYEKVKDLIENKLGGKLEDAVFYANSHLDIPLLNKVGKQVVVNPTDKLRVEAKKRGWQILKYEKIVKAE